MKKIAFTIGMMLVVISASALEQAQVDFKMNAHRIKSADRKWCYVKKSDIQTQKSDITDYLSFGLRFIRTFAHSIENVPCVTETASILLFICIIGSKQSATNATLATKSSTVLDFQPTQIIPIVRLSGIIAM